MTTSSSSSSSSPALPPLYFEEQQRETPQLPSELMSMTLEYCNWGDLAKLANVQKSWQRIMADAASHSLEAKWGLAQSLLNGTNGLSTNPIRAIEIMKELANIEIDMESEDATITNPQVTCYAPAMNQISECYFHGIGVNKSSKTGLLWLQASFEYGEDITAAHEMALIYEYGRNEVEVDVIAAFNWFEKAAGAGHVEAMTELGLCYELGCGVEQDDETALDWYTKAANLGHVTAKFSVGEAFEAARGVPQSDEEACLWYYRAALVGDEDSKVALRRLYDIARIIFPGVSALLNV